MVEKRILEKKRCLICLELTNIRYIGNCPKCNLRGICGNCLMEHLEKHGKTKEQELLDDIMGEEKTKITFGNDTFL